jgi:beta-glucanase (GH16 family)
MPGADRGLRRRLIAAALVGVAGIGWLAADTVASDPLATAGAGFRAETHDDCGIVRKKADGSDWECTFIDEFGGTKLSGKKWITQDTMETDFSTEMTCLRRSEKNIRVNRGVLELTARDEGDPFDCGRGLGNFWTEYTGGMIGTRTKFSQTYGKFEMRAKWPDARLPGLHGAFWMNPLDMAYGSWPRSGEIDIAEWWSAKPDLVIPSLHFTGRDGKVDSGWNCKVEDVSDWHTYAVDWSATGFKFSIDGKVCFTRRPVPSAPLLAAPQPFDKPFSIVLNMGVGLKNGINKVDDNTPLPATLTVDYVKAWS